MNYIKHTSISFLNKNHLKRKELNLNTLLHTARQNGYIVKHYTNATELLIYYDIYDRAQKSASLSVTDVSGNTLIFIDDSLSENKQLFALAHEIGHIKLEHTPCKDKKLKNKQEREANLFAHYLLTGTAPLRINIYIALILTLLFISLTVLLLSLPLPTKKENVNASAPIKNDTVVSSDMVTVAPPSSSSVSAPTEQVKKETICYYTEYGTVYHLYRDCSYLKHSKTIYTSTIDKCPMDRLCSRCADR